MRLLLAATVATGLAFAPAILAPSALAPTVLAKDAVKPATSKGKTYRTAKARKTTRGVSRAAVQKTNGHPLGEPYTMQKDEMTR